MLNKFSLLPSGVPAADPGNKVRGMLELLASSTSAEDVSLCCPAGIFCTEELCSIGGSFQTFA